MKSHKRKNYLLAEAKIKKLRRLLKAKTQTEAIEKAVDLVLFQRAASRAWVEKAGAGGVDNLYGWDDRE